MTGRPVCTLVGRESALLRNTTELIQQNVAERMTFLIADSWRKGGPWSKRINGYALRSRFIHHGHTIDEFETVKSSKMIDSCELKDELAKGSRKYDIKERLIGRPKVRKSS